MLWHDADLLLPTWIVSVMNLKKFKEGFFFLCIILKYCVSIPIASKRNSAWIYARVLTS